MRARLQKLGALALLGLAAAAAGVSGASAGEPVPNDTKPPLLAPVEPSLGSRVLEAILPRAMQKRPLILFNAITEMTEDGRKWRQPTPEKPMYYLMNTGKFTQAGWQVAAGERPPPVAELEAGMRKALATNGYVALTKPEERPELLVIFSFGSHGTDPESAIPPSDAGTPPVGAGELLPIVISDVALFKDVIARATLVGGEKFAMQLKAVLDEEVRNSRMNQTADRNPGNQLHLPVSPEFGSPFESFLMSGKNSSDTAHLAEMAFHTCYFVIASAYDFDAAQKNQRRLLWRTKMTVEAQGVSMAEILGPLISNTAPYLGRETGDAVVVKKRISRDGKVEVGRPTVIEDVVPAPPAEQPSRR